MRILTNTNYKFIEKRKTAYLISTLLILAGLAGMIRNVATIGTWLNYGVDFTGGTLVQVEFNQDVTADQIRDAVGDASVAEFGDPREFVVRAPLAEGVEVAAIREQIESQLRETFGEGAFTVIRTELVGPTIGEELQRKAALAIVISFGLTLIYLAFRFEFRFGVAAVVATIHDLIITLGIIALFQMEIMLPTIAAILTIVGYSINDKIVIFDRIRENMNAKGARKEDPIALINRSINETIPRTVMTGLSVLLSLLSLVFFGPLTLLEFSLVLFLGIVIGTYSSMFIGSPALIEIQSRFGKGADKKPRKRQPEPAGV